MTNYKKWLPYLAVYLLGLFTAAIVFKLNAISLDSSTKKQPDTIALKAAPNFKAITPPKMEDLIAKMQNNFRHIDQDQNNEDLMAQFHNMRKKMLQLLEEEGASANAAFGNIENLNEISIESREDDKNYYFDLDIKHLDQNSLKMDIKDGYIYFTGEMKKEEKQETGLGVSSSTTISSFSKTVPIPSDAVQKKSKIEQRDGVLTITMPKNKKE